MLNTELLKILCCPETHQDLRIADSSVIARLNGLVNNGSLRNRAGHLVNVTMDDGLTRADGKFLYPVCKNVPVMLSDQAIPLRQEQVPSPKQ